MFFIRNKIATSKLPPSLNGDRIASCIQPHLPYLNSENLNITTYTTHFKPEAEHNIKHFPNLVIHNMYVQQKESSRHVIY
jgi:hypothetical protein